MKRDMDPFLAVIAAHKGIIYKVANLYCRDEENRKDLIQEILIQLWLSFPKYNEQYKLSTWMYRIALNVAISFYRKENSRHPINHPLPEQVLYLQEEQGGGNRDTDLDHLHRFIKELKEIDRAVIILYLEKNSQQEISKILGLTATNVATKVARIKQQLQQKFSGLST
ncbi:RNA polymerase sigma factor [Chitinophaga nivalis]|uniref:RNA polymerase sigma factor n=1 Tax=Chitinophaga nivalis TaxID=2991709 RepID=A0ABT3IHJ6_9BACT|nr:RNA polymerase sigma factor [Chitinophaga nivalis]MCW3467075.1 RNA polymerase sigma factor [Chitinophaga nivalis]MCW3483234.1 RNA polymerase sigma factor [Chitinophaga nivalis]